MQTLKFILASIALVVAPDLVIAQTADGPLILESSVSVSGTDKVEHESGVIQLPMHKFTSTIPATLAKQVFDKTRIKCENIGACASAHKKGFKFGAVTILGDRFSCKGTSTTAGIETKNDFSYDFKPLLQTSSDSTFVTQGAFRFQNNLTGSQCFVVCRISGKRTKDEKLSYNSEWIGPLNKADNNATKALSLIFEHEKPTAK